MTTVKVKKPRKKAMSTASRKAKGRNLQKAIAEMFLEYFTELTISDVFSTGMGQSGSDVKLSQAALARIPYDIEAKNQESVSVWMAYTQTVKRCAETLEPLLVIKRNGKSPLAVVDLRHFVELVHGNFRAKQ